MLLINTYCAINSNTDGYSFEIKGHTIRGNFQCEAYNRMDIRKLVSTKVYILKVQV